MKKSLKILSYLLLILIFLECFLQVSYLVTKHHYFLNKYEFETKFNILRSINTYPEDLFRNNYKIKIGIFGGSSALGYASQISFSSILKNYFYYTNKDIQIVNYSSSGLPFAGYVSKLIKNEMHKYDLIIIYAGHNEWQMEPYNVKSFDNGLPNPFNFTELDKGFNNTISELEKRKKINMMTGGDKIFNQYTSYSRLINFIFRSYDKFSSIINLQRLKHHQKNIEKKNLYKNPSRQFYYEKQIVNKQITNKWKNKFFYELSSIIENLRNDQKLIISTVMSDIFFPPIYDFYKYYNPETNLLFKNAYTALINQEDIDLEDLPRSANKYFLEGYQCFIKKRKDQNICYTSLIKAKDKDNIALRIQSNINNNIRKINNKNTIVIDPLKFILENSNTTNEFREYFVDYQHPSPKGHLLIASKILKEIIPKNNKVEFDILDQCGSYRMKINEDEIHDIIIKKKYCKHIAEINYKWLQNIERFVPKEIEFFFNIHKNRAKKLISIN